MKTLKNIPSIDVVAMIREDSGRADFITLLLHDGEIKLNDPGDIAIPSRTLRSKILDLHKSDLVLLSEITNFICEVSTK